MRNCQVRFNMYLDVYIEENSQVKMLNDVINEIYYTADYTVQSKWMGDIPEDIMMKILIFGKYGVSRSWRYFRM